MSRVIEFCIFVLNNNNNMKYLPEELVLVEQINGVLINHTENKKYNIYKVVEKVKKKYKYGTYTLIDIFKGRGWCNKLQNYKGVKRKGGWNKGENYSFGQTINSHYSKMKRIDTSDNVYKLIQDYISL